MLRRWYAISASRSNGRKRKSDIIFVTSKSKKVGRASDMNAVPVWGSLDYCAVHNDRYIGRCSGGVKGFFAPQQLGAGAQCGHGVAQQFAAQHVERRLVGLKRVESPHHQVEQTVPRPLVRLGCRWISQHDLVDPVIESAEDCLFGMKDPIHPKD